MKFSIKKMTAAVLSLVMTVTMGASAYADELDVQEHVQIHGHDCTVENGQYYTVIDGERCQVINLDDYIPEVTIVSAGEYANEEDTHSLTGARAYGSPLYSDTVNVKRDGDYCSPMINCSPILGFTLKILDCAFGSVNLRVNLYGAAPNDTIIGEVKEKSYHFNILVTENRLEILGGAEVGELTKRCVLKIYKDGTSVSPFSYALYDD